MARRDPTVLHALFVSREIGWRTTNSRKNLRRHERKGCWNMQNMLDHIYICTYMGIYQQVEVPWKEAHSKIPSTSEAFFLSFPEGALWRRESLCTPGWWELQLAAAGRLGDATCFFVLCVQVCFWFARFRSYGGAWRKHQVNARPIQPRRLAGAGSMRELFRSLLHIHSCQPPAPLGTRPAPLEPLLFAGIITLISFGLRWEALQNLLVN